MSDGTTHQKISPRRRAIPWLFVALLALVFVYLNAAPRTGGSMAFEEQHFRGLAQSRGWPIRSWTLADAEGLGLVYRSDIMGGTVVYRNVSRDTTYPHLLVQWLFVGIDLFVAFASLGVSWFLARKLIVVWNSERRFG